MNIIDIINTARSMMPMRKRGSNSELYKALVLTMRASRLCINDPIQNNALRKAIAELPLGNKNRQYIERGSDAYQRVCRYVFWGEEHTANINRYAHALREADKEGIDPDELFEKLKKGGVNQFYLRRPLSSNLISTKCIRLSEQITHKKLEVFTIKLLRNQDNSYTVLEKR